MAPTPNPAWRLQLRNLTVAFGSRVIQRDLSFSIRQGSIFAIMGGSGCGKSTVLKTMIGLLRPTAGATVVIVSHELRSLFSICDDGVFLDAERKTAIAYGSPRALRDDCDHPTVRAFMTSGQLERKPPKDSEP